MTSHDQHYKQMRIQPIEVMEMIIEREDIPLKSRLNLCIALNYQARAGTKEDWRKDVEKAQNHIHRALHGVWPWDPVQPLLQHVKDSLKTVSPDAPMASWLRVCFSAIEQCGTEAEPLIEEWSKQSAKYKPNEMLTLIKRINPYGKGA
jgi:hypothetical protein